MKASRPLHIRTRDSLWISLSTRQRPIRSGARRWRGSGGPRSRSAARWIVGRGHRPFSQRPQVTSSSGVFFIASCATVTGPSDLSVIISSERPDPYTARRMGERSLLDVRMTTGRRADRAGRRRPQTAPSGRHGGSSRLDHSARIQCGRRPRETRRASVSRCASQFQLRSLAWRKETERIVNP